MSAHTRIDWPTTALTRALLADPLDLDYVVVLDDFIGGATGIGVGALGWLGFNITTAGSSDWIAGEANHPGIYRLATGTNDNDGQGICLNFGSSFSEVGRIPPLNALTGWRVRFMCRLGSTANISVRWGLAVDTNAIQPADGIWWQYDTDASDTNFSAVCRASSTETTTASSVAADTSWHAFDIFCTSSGTISFSIDGGSATTIATNVPTVGLSAFFNCVTRVAAASKSCDIDTWGLMMTVSR